MRELKRYTYLVEPYQLLGSFYFEIGKHEQMAETFMKKFELSMVCNIVNDVGAAHVAIEASIAMGKHGIAQDYMRRIILGFSREVIAEILRKHGFDLNPFLHLF